MVPVILGGSYSGDVHVCSWAGGVVFSYSCWKPNTSWFCCFIRKAFCNKTTGDLCFEELIRGFVSNDAGRKVLDGGSHVVTEMQTSVVWTESKWVQSNQHMWTEKCVPSETRSRKDSGSLMGSSKTCVCWMKFGRKYVWKGWPRLFSVVVCLFF